MDARLLVLKLFLDELGVSAEIGTVDDRKRVQKAVYLGQVAGADLGYRFSWYLMGPYCTGLTRDYYAMSEALSSGEGAVGKELHPDVRASLGRVKPLITPPKDWKLGQEDWLELLASYDYLRRVRGQDHKTASKVLADEKPNLAPHAEEAAKALRRPRLLK